MGAAVLAAARAEAEERAERPRAEEAAAAEPASPWAFAPAERRAERQEASAGPWCLRLAAAGCVQPAE